MLDGCVLARELPAFAIVTVRKVEVASDQRNHQETTGLEIDGLNRAPILQSLSDQSIVFISADPAPVRTKVVALAIEFDECWPLTLCLRYFGTA